MLGRHTKIVYMELVSSGIKSRPAYQQMSLKHANDLKKLQDEFKSKCFESYNWDKLVRSAYLYFYAVELKSNFGLSASNQTSLKDDLNRRKFKLVCPKLPFLCCRVYETSLKKSRLSLSTKTATEKCSISKPSSKMQGSIFLQHCETITKFILTCECKILCDEKIIILSI